MVLHSSVIFKSWSVRPTIHSCFFLLQKIIDVLENTEVKLVRFSKQVTNNEYIITIIKENRVMQVSVQEMSGNRSKRKLVALSPTTDRQLSLADHLEPKNNYSAF